MQINITAAISYMRDNFHKAYRYYIEGGYQNGFFDFLLADSPEELAKLYIESIDTGDKYLFSGNDKQIKKAIECYEVALSSIQRLRKEFPNYQLPSPHYPYATLAFREAFVYTKLGKCHGKLGQYQEAIVYYDRSITCHKLCLEAYVGRTQTLMILKQYQEAIDTSRELLNLYEDKEFLDKQRPYLSKDTFLANKISVYIDRASNFIALGKYNLAQVELEYAKTRISSLKLVELKQKLPMTLSQGLLAAIASVEEKVKVNKEKFNNKIHSTPGEVKIIQRSNKFFPMGINAHLNTSNLTNLTMTVPNYPRI